MKYIYINTYCAPGVVPSCNCSAISTRLPVDLLYQSHRDSTSPCFSGRLVPTDRSLGRRRRIDQTGTNTSIDSSSSLLLVLGSYRRGREFHIEHISSSS
ncbi:hypothetical protein YC2023_072523 [Brassica napus]